MWKTERCPRCGGNLYEERYLGTREVRCLQCGHDLTAAELATIDAARAARRVQPVAASRPVVRQAA